MSKSKQVVTPKDIAKSLDKISAWVRGVRSAVLKMDKKSTARIGNPGPMASASPPMLDGCPPPPFHPIKKDTKKKKSK